MKRLAKLETWLHGLVGGFVGGGASAASAYMGLAVAHSAGLDVPALNVKAAGVIFLTSGAATAMAYLKQSPLPDLADEEAKSKAP